MVAELVLTLARDRQFMIALSVGYSRSMSVPVKTMISKLLSPEPPIHGYKVTKKPHRYGGGINPELYEAILQNTWLDSVHVIVYDMPEYVSYVLALFEGKTNISELSLTVRTASHDYHPTLLSVLKTLNLTSFSLIGVTVILGVAEVLSAHDKLKIVRLGSNRIEWDERIAFVGSMLCMVPILKLDYRSSDLELRFVADYLKADSVVEMLSLTVSPDANLVALGDALRINTSLKSLSIMTNRLPVNFMPIFDGLRQNTSLIKLELELVREVDVYNVTRMIQDNTTLEVLKLGFNRFGTDEVTQNMTADLITALKASNLLELKVTGGAQRMFTGVVEAIELNRHNATQKGVSLLRILL